MTATWVIEPRHGFFAKDARGWFAGAGYQANSLAWILPTTLRGALCTAIGRELESAAQTVFSPATWLSLKAGLHLDRVLALRAVVGSTSFSAKDRMWPAPSDAVFLAGQTRPTALVAKSPNVKFWDRHDDPALASLDLLTIDESSPARDAKPQNGPAWWTEAEFVAWLLGNPKGGPDPKLAGSRQTVSRTDVHVKMDNQTYTADNGFLWAQEFQETLTRRYEAEGKSLDRWAFAVSFRLNDQQAQQAKPTVATIAGDRHLASIIPTDPLDMPPSDLQTAIAAAGPLRRIRLYAITPTVFKNGWYPDDFAMDGGRLVGGLPGIPDTPVRLVAAAVGRPVPISGWDRATSSPGSTDNLQDGGGVARSTRLACPAGSVWVLERCDGLDFSPEDAVSLWLKQWGQDQDDGLGLLVAGRDYESAYQ